jgi:hypothetical protein
MSVDERDDPEAIGGHGLLLSVVIPVYNEQDTIRAVVAPALLTLYGIDPESQSLNAPAFILS